MKDFKTWVETSSSGKLDGSHELVGKADVSADYDSVDGLADSVSIKKKKVDLSAIRSTFSGRYRCRNIRWCEQVLAGSCC